MPRLSEKLLVILLALLLGLAPLQSALASFATSSDQGDGMHQLASMHGGMVMATDHAAAHDCEQCNADANCNGLGCSSSHCVSCVLALLPVFSLPTYLTAASVSFRADNGFVSQLSSSPFRPPRA